MLNVLVIGVGGGGNAAVFQMITKEVVSEKNVLLINKTERDIPEGFKGAVCIINSEGSGDLGSGKEREIGKKEAVIALQSGKLNIEKFIMPTTDLVIVVCTTEGGTGSGAAVVIANYIDSVLGINTHLVGFTGFENDARGLRNTVGFFKDIPASISVSIKRNKKYLKGSDFLTAEEEANTDFCIEMSIMMGNAIKKSTHNIDRADLLKVSALTPGYKIIEYIEIDEIIKNVEMYNSYVRRMIDNSKAMDITSASQKALAVIINLPESETKFIDGNQTELQNTYGKTYDIFAHIQSYKDMPSFIAFISSGMNVPIDQVEGIYSRYLDSSKLVKKDEDKFFNTVQSFEYDEDDSMFDTSESSSRRQSLSESKSNFFSTYSMETPNRPASNASPNGKKDKDGLLEKY